MQSLREFGLSLFNCFWADFKSGTVQSHLSTVQWHYLMKFSLFSSQKIPKMSECIITLNFSTFYCPIFLLLQRSTDKDENFGASANSNFINTSISAFWYHKEEQNTETKTETRIWEKYHKNWYWIIVRGFFRSLKNSDQDH